MVPPRTRLSLSKERFPAFLTNLKSQPYHDPSSSSRGHTLRSIAWNPLGTLVATGSSDKTLRVWNPEKPNVRFSTELKGHSAAIEKVAFNPVKDAELCSVSNDGVVKFWDVRSKTCINEIRGLGDAFTLVWAPDGQSLVVGNKTDNIFVLSPTQSAPISSHQQPSQTNQIAFDWAGDTIFLTTGEGRTRILTYPDFKPAFQFKHGDESKEFTLNGHTSSCLTAELQPTGRYLATGGSDSIISLWDTTDWICQRTITSMIGPVRSISFTFDGNFLVGGSDEGSGLDIRHAESGDHVHTFKTAGPCPVVAWAPTKYCLAYSDLGVLRIVGVDAEKK
ncbi:WD domain-containing protein [Colletotrichum abscissum]|uniref:WD domain-containing protein n=1 Tax=Colletotrichum abscissum TaxID=1671311 RepID=A0A9P9XIC1_9PEZI|nr:WD domain-containing protein [Colletotrichum abscissum]KAI3554752.1 WD domain-containing protein [Colletotrichum abscissum]KAK1472766.1 WD domain-containing protein [Colletotrichum abscissum]KAK1709011.1 WD domain-containing protein [Colletotrichum lupini]